MEQIPRKDQERSGLGCADPGPVGILFTIWCLIKEHRRTKVMMMMICIVIAYLVVVVVVLIQVQDSGRDGKLTI